MAIAATWLTTGYKRDFVITNNGPSRGYVSLGSIVCAQAFTGGTVSVSIGLASIVSYV